MHKKYTKSTLERSVHRLKLLKLNHDKGFTVCFDLKKYHKTKKSNVRQVTPVRYVIRGDWFVKQLSTDIFKESPLPPTPEPLKKVKDMTIDEQTSMNARTQIKQMDSNVRNSKVSKEVKNGPTKELDNIRRKLRISDISGRLQIFERKTKPQGKHLKSKERNSKYSNNNARTQIKQMDLNVINSKVSKEVKNGPTKELDNIRRKLGISDISRRLQIFERKTRPQGKHLKFKERNSKILTQ
ncbi:hypothetical protein ACOME3_009225 [Neoechinorhynchus agilis]